MSPARPVLLLALAACSAAQQPALTVPAPLDRWAPLGRSELHPWGAPRIWSWRDAAVGGPWVAFDAALDAAGRVVVATVEKHDGAPIIRVRRLAGEHWEALPDLGFAPPDEGGSIQLALTTDPRDQPVVAWAWRRDGRGDRVGWARLAQGRWEAHDVPALPTETWPFGVVADGRSDVRLYAYAPTPQADDVVYELRTSGAAAWIAHPVPSRRAVVTPSVAGRLAWAFLGPDDHVAWSGPDRVSDPPADVRAHDAEGETARRGDPLLVHAPGGWRWLAARSGEFDAAAAASPTGRPTLVEGYDHLVGTHYFTEFNRVETWQGHDGAWEKLSPAPLVTPLLPRIEHLRLLPTPQPTLVLGTGPVSVLQWNGEQWWGVGGSPESLASDPAGDLSDPTLGASHVQFVGDELRWRELTESGERLRRARWTGGAWTAVETLALPGAAWLWGQDTGRTHVLLRFAGTWDRVHGLMGEVPAPAFFQWAGATREDLPMPVPTASPPGCGGEGQPACLPGALLELPDGTVLAALTPPQVGIRLGARPPDPPWEIQHYAAGRWSTEVTTDARSWHNPSLCGGDPVSAWFDDRVLVRDAGAWTRIAPPPDAGTFMTAIGLGGGRLLAVGLDEEYQGSGGPLRVTEWDGAAWEARGVGLPTEAAEAAVLARGPDGGTWLAAEVGGEIRLYQLTEAGWIGLGGSDGPRGVTDSPAPSTGPAIGFLDGRVCVGWIEAADQEPRVNVRCHGMPR
ncbi:MAG: hypothetical protein V4850_14175 [Myxococcota bacterium]